MSSITDVIINATEDSVVITAEVYLTSNSAFRIDITLYNMDGSAVKRGWQSWSEGSAPLVREFTLRPDYLLPSATQYEYAIQLSYRDSGDVIDRVTGYAATKLAHFEWDSQKVRGEDVNITANEWNRLLDVCAAEVKYVRKWNYYSSLC